MALDFPSNPTNGQVYANYIYDSSITSWRNVNTDTGIGTLNAMGLKNVVPTSVVVGSGSATTNANGLVTFSSASSVEIRNVFTSTYNTYVVKTSVTGWSNSPTTTAIQGRLTKAGVNPGGYYYQAQYDNNNNANGAWTNGVNNSQFFMGDIGTGYTGNQYNSIFEIFNPQNSAVGTDGLGRSVALTVSYYGHGMHSFHQNSADIQDGFYIFPASGNFTGTIQVFGYTN